MKYVGSELELFSKAERWKQYLSSSVRPFLRGRVLEVGAGIGGTTRFLLHPGITAWTCLEPDRELAEQINAEVQSGELPSCRVVQGFLSDLEDSAAFDAIIYLDVLEHIEDDSEELKQATTHLSAGGSLVVAGPAQPWLFSEFDRSIGHFRRYSKASLSALKPPELHLERVFYLDSAGILASLANKMLLKQAAPTPQQIAFWDKWIVGVSRFMDPALRHSIGKSVVAVWRKP